MVGMCQVRKVYPSEITMPMHPRIPSSLPVALLQGGSQTPQTKRRMDTMPMGFRKLIIPGSSCTPLHPPYWGSSMGSRLRRNRADTVSFFFHRLVPPEMPSPRQSLFSQYTTLCKYCKRLSKCFLGTSPCGVMENTL